jgi:hypothetical protein
MRYEEYLFVCALRDCSTYFESCPYHTQYEKGGELYKKYLESELSKNSKVLYNSYNKFFKQLEIVKIEGWLRREFSIKTLCMVRPIGLTNLEKVG